METTEITLKILHDCSQTCGMCSGSGEGMADGANCTYCKGHGTLYPPGFNWKNSERELEVIVEVDEVGNLLTESWECDDCGAELIGDIKEEMKCR